MEQIRPILDDGVVVDELRGMLRLRSAQIEAHLSEEHERLARVQARLRLIEREDDMARFDIVIKRIAPQRCGHVVPTALRKYGIKTVGSWFPSDGVEVFVVPGVERAATVVHRGELTSSAEYYQALATFIENNGCTTDGPGRDASSMVHALTLRSESSRCNCRCAPRPEARDSSRTWGWGMSFFRDRSAPEPENARAMAIRRQMMQSAMSFMQPPEDELGVLVPMAPVVLLRNDDLLLAASGIEAFSNGFLLRLSVLAHKPEALVQRGPNFHPMGGPGSVLFGVQYSDGRRGDTAMPPDPSAMRGSPDRILIMRRGGHGGPRRLDQSVWIHPLPPSGPIIFVAQWREVGLEEQRHEVDSEAILTSAAGSTPMWPREPTPDEAPAPEDLEAALLGALTHQLAGIEGARIRGVLFDGHHPDTTLLIAYDTLSPQRVSGELRVSVWNENDADLAHRPPMEIGAAIVAQLRAAVA